MFITFCSLYLDIGCTYTQGLPLAVVMEYVSGGTLKDLLNDPLSDKMKLKVLIEIGKALREAHSHKLYHKALRPKNVLVRFQIYSPTQYITVDNKGPESSTTCQAWQL